MRDYFPAVFGNRDLRKTLGKSVEQGTLAHAIIIEGAPGSGKSLLATELAAACLCENKDDPSFSLPCHSCRSCRLVKERNAPDVHLIDRGEKSTLGVDAVREAKRDVHLSATEFDSKFYIFDQADALTVQAQNALLTVFEEPPEGVKILLLCENADNLLTTVRSRARLIKMQRFTAEEIRLCLSKNYPDLLRAEPEREREIEDVLLRADGSVGEAIRLLAPKSREEIAKQREWILSLLEAVSRDSFSLLCDAFSQLPSKREEVSQTLSTLHLALRDLILLKRDEEAPLVFFPRAEDVPSSISALRIGALYAMSDLLKKTLAELDRNANITAALTALKCNMCGIQKVR